MAVNDFVRKPSTAKTLEFTVDAGGEDIGEFRILQDTWLLAWNAEESFDPDTLVAAKLATGVYACDDAEIPKVVGSGEDMAAGNALYFSPTDKNVSKTKAGTHLFWVGTAIRAALSTAAKVAADFDMQRVNQ